MSPIWYRHVKAPGNGLSQDPERLLLFRHDYSSPNVLQMVNNAAEVLDETIIEIVLTAACMFSDLYIHICSLNNRNLHFIPIYSN